MKEDFNEIAKAKRRAKFGRGVKAGHAMRRAAIAADLASRNAYRVAIGLPPVEPKPTRAPRK